MTFPVDGLYALASLDGAPLTARDRLALGLSPIPEDSRFAVAARDLGADTAIAADHVFLGHIDEQAALAATLGLAPSTATGVLVQAAIDRFGDDTPARILGEWTFLRWDGPSRTLTLMVSDTVRDTILFATDGRRVAVAPHIRALRRLDWIDPVPRTPNLLLHMGRAPLRSTIDDRTILRDVRKVRAGTCVTIVRGDVTVSTRRPLPSPNRWQGSFADAIEELDAMLRRIVRAQMVRCPSSAVMLSGGLDSSLVAVFAAAERVAGGALVALTSAAPAGSGLLDEVEFSRAVAEQAGIAMIPVVPEDDGDPYRPSDTLLDWLQQPIVSPRHYVYDALYRRASDCGAQGIFDACEGEWTVTGYPDGLGWRQRLRDALSGLATFATTASTQDAFHVRLSPQAIATAERDLRGALRAPGPAPLVHRRNDVWGYSPSIAQNLGDVTTTPLPGLRRLMPLRDRRLLTLFAGMPYHFLTRGGVMRAPGRALLAGKVPDSVRLRKQGRPFSPDYRIRIQRHALPARSRLPGYERAGVGEWLDLAWLDGALAQVAARPDAPLALVFQVQATATAAAFLAYWLSGD